MSYWGVFIDKRNFKHVMPSGPDGEVLNGHVVDTTCWCKPKQDEEDSSVIIHNDPERGGFNS